MSAPRFYNKNGTLTRYAFGCGYVERYGPMTLWLEGTYHVRGFPSDGAVRVWEVFESVVAARKFARTLGAFMPAVDAYSGI